VPAIILYNAAEVLVCAQQHNDVTRCIDIDMLPYGPLCANIIVIHETRNT